MEMKRVKIEVVGIRPCDACFRLDICYSVVKQLYGRMMNTHFFLIKQDNTVHVCLIFECHLLALLNELNKSICKHFYTSRQYLAHWRSLVETDLEPLLW